MTCLAKNLLRRYCAHSDVAIRRVPAESEFTIGRNFFPQLGILRISENILACFIIKLGEENWENYGMVQGDQNCWCWEGHLLWMSYKLEVFTETSFDVQWMRNRTRSETNLGQPKIMKGTCDAHLPITCNTKPSYLCQLCFNLSA